MNALISRAPAQNSMALVPRKICSKANDYF